MIQQLLCLLYWILVVRCEHEFLYPSHLPISTKNIRKQEPLYAPSICPKNHLLYPGNQENDWVCDCEPGYVYYPEENGCFAVYRQGPCQEDQYIVLPKGEFRPKCERNPCGKDGVVQYKGICHPLDKLGGPCERSNEAEPISVLTIVKSTLKIQCVTSLTGLSLIVAPTSCPPGSRRSNSNDCRISEKNI